ncbi:hypothetical protein [Micromonospora sp. NPDC047740]|uniref:hypothetical protein n=1 Tax=Micromonospora sp. NPDC047740 TaxID=3364254 RepID=UPI003724AA0F
MHLARQHEPLEQGRGAVPDHYLTGGDSEREAVQRRYDVEALPEPNWEHTTRCVDGGYSSTNSKVNQHAASRPEKDQPRQADTYRCG